MGVLSSGTLSVQALRNCVRGETWLKLVLRGFELSVELCLKGLTYAQRCQCRNVAYLSTNVDC